MQKIVIGSGAFSGTEFQLTSDGMLLGRHTDSPLCDVFRSMSGVSRRHAQILFHEDHFVLEDLQSRNGTKLNGSSVTHPVRLRSGDRLWISEVQMLFVDDSPLAKSASTRSQSIHDSGSICSTFQVGPAAELDISIDAPRKLQSLVRMLGKIGGSLDSEKVLAELLDGMFDVFDNAEHGFVALRDEKQSVIPCVIRNKNPQEKQEVRFSNSIVSHVITEQQAVLSRNAVIDERFQAQSVLLQDISSLMCTPLNNQAGECLGVVQLESADENPFTQGDLEILASVTPYAAMVVDYARIHADELRRQALESDLEFARQIQRNFLPSRDPQFDDYQFFSYYEPAFQVGGDYYDYLELPGNRLAVVIADVAGKGVSAGLVMSKFSGEFKYILAQENSLAGGIAKMNESLIADSGMRFLTVAALVLNLDEHSVQIVNAGHCESLLRLANGNVKAIDEDIKGTPIGMFPDQVYQSKKISVEPGDTLLVFSDGLTEAMQADNSLYGMDRIISQLELGPADPKETAHRLLSDVRHFVGDHPQSDDMCLVCFQRNAQ